MSQAFPVRLVGTKGTGAILNDAGDAIDLTASVGTGLGVASTGVNWVEFSVVVTDAAAEGFFRVAFDGSPPGGNAETGEVETMTFMLGAADGSSVSYGPFLMRKPFTEIDTLNKTGATITVAYNVGIVKHDHRTSIGPELS